MRNALGTLGLACALLATSQGHAQSDAEFKSLNAQVMELYRVGKFAEAIPLAKRLADAVKARSGPDQPEYATVLNNLAQLLQDTNRPGEAEPLMRRALAIDEKSLGPQHPNVARDLNNPAALFQATNRYGEAEPLYRRALAIVEKSFGLEHPNVATT